MKIWRAIDTDRDVLAVHAELDWPWEAGLWNYCLLILATDTPIKQARAHLKDTGSAKHARGRLLLQAAEIALREAGDTKGDS